MHRTVHSKILHRTLLVIVISLSLVRPALAHLRAAAVNKEIVHAPSLDWNNETFGKAPWEIQPSRPGTPKPKFLSWEPSYGDGLNTTLHRFCARQYAFYLTNDGTQGCRGCNIEPAVTCILDHASAYSMANMQSAQVLLGILPTVMALAGMSSASLGFLAMRRPLLASLLATGCPAANPRRAVEYQGDAY